MSNRAKLYAKILNVVSKMETIEKSGYNQHQKYAYSTEEDLVSAIRALLIDNKLLVLTSSETKEVQKLNKSDKNSANGFKETLLTVVNTKHKFIDTETGEFEEVTSTGTGWDDTDKGSFKAITGAFKYFISKNFLVPSKDDAENDGLPKPDAPPAQQSTPKSFNRPGAPKVNITSPGNKVEISQEGDVAKVTISGPVPKEEPKEELLVKTVAPKTFPRRTVSSEPKF